MSERASLISKDHPTDLADAARTLALETAAKNNTSARDLVKRGKSQAYLFGTLRRRFPAEPESRIREVLDALKHEELIDLEPVQLPDRAPIKGREPVSDPCWGRRIAQLLSVLDGELPGPELSKMVMAELGWDANFTAQTMAAAEELGALVFRIGPRDEVTEELESANWDLSDRAKDILEEAELDALLWAEMKAGPEVRQAEERKPEPVRKARRARQPKQLGLQLQIARRRSRKAPTGRRGASRTRRQRPIQLDLFGPVAPGSIASGVCQVGVGT